jgi:aldose 1-epimerase
MRLRTINYGAVVVSLETPDRKGECADVVLGFNTMEEYLDDSPFFGAIVGRYGNRIAGGRFDLDGTTHVLACNNTPAGMPCAAMVP